VKSVTNFIREPTWIAPLTMPGYEARKFSAEEKREFLENPNKHLEFRKGIERNGNAFFPLFISDSDSQKQAKEFYRQGMRDQIPDEDLKDKLTPMWDVGCRRLTPGTGYLSSLSSDKSSVVYGEIVKISPKGPITEDGREHPVEVLICATGFDTTFKPRFRLQGLNGELLAETWKDEPASYLGLAAAGFPNYFMFLGPNCPIGNGPVLVGIEAQADYMITFIRKYRQEDIKYARPAIKNDRRHR